MPQGVIVGVKQAMDNDPVYGDSIGETWTWLSDVADEARVVRLGSARCPGPPPVSPHLGPRAGTAPSHLDTWAQTSDDPRRAEISNSGYMTRVPLPPAFRSWRATTSMLQILMQPRPTR
ncbi:MAG: hypothetical protein R3F49_12210 [Planctomycetota bacterium]